MMRISLPERHRELLERELQFHEQRIDSLRQDQEYIAREIRIHELVLSLGRDRQILEALSELAEDPQAASRARDDAGSYAREKGISLPEGLDVGVEVEGDKVVVSVAYRDEVFPMMLSWDSESGFSAHGLEPSGPAAP
jgi:hypothetical protein